MPDLPAILDAIRERPGGGGPGLALASWLWDNGRDDEAAAVRVFWPTLRDEVESGGSVHFKLRWMARHARRLRTRARHIEELTGPPR